MSNTKKKNVDYATIGKIGYHKTKKYLIANSHRKQKEAIEKYKKADKRCANCNKPLSYKKRRNKFCNRSCSASFNNRNTIRNSKTIRKCLGCGEPIDRRGCRYCSFCDSVGKNKNILPFKKLKSDRSRKRRLLHEEGNICSICKRRTWMGKPIPLVADHIDGNSENNARNNLRLVCGNCDMQLPTYKGKNYGNGRYSRRYRYKQKKSY